MVKLLLSLLAAVTAIAAQDAQQPPAESKWPCVASKGIDPSYIATAEATGGEVFLFDRSEIGRSTPLLIASHQHHDTIFRATGELTQKSRQFEFPVDSTVESLLIVASIQCRDTIVIRSPGDTESPGAESHDFRAIKMMQVRLPQPGRWQVRIAGRGIFFLLVRAKSPITLGSVTFVDPETRRPVPGPPKPGVESFVEAYLAGDFHDVAFHLVSPAAEDLEEITLARVRETGPYAGPVTPKVPAFRIAVRGKDERGWPFQRLHAPLFRTGEPAPSSPSGPDPAGP